MDMTDSRPRPWSRARRLALAVTAAVAVAGFAAPASQADVGFVSPLCGGSAITGAGATFQQNAHVGWEANFKSATWCGAGGPDITYNALGSGAGRRALGERGSGNLQGNRDPVVRFAGTDEAPTLTQIDQIEQGPTVNPDGSGGDLQNSDDGDLRTIPVAAGSIAIVVNMPGNCRVRDISPQATEAAFPAYRRFFAENVDWENAFAGEVELTWGNLLPDIDGVGPRSDASCQAVPVKRVRRADSSGTTFAFKRWLAVFDDGTENWETLGNTVWPNDSGSTQTVQGTGNTGVADAVNANDGSIGYVELGTARARGFRKNGEQDGTFWIKVKNGSGELREPSADQNITDGVLKGSDCAGVTFTGLPTLPSGDITRGDWSSVTGRNSPTAYGLCTLTYILAFDDYADVYGCNSAEEMRARTVFDYLTSIVHPSGQSKLKQFDLSKLSTGGAAGNLRGTAAQSVNRIDWCV
jgi:ABC-type phosphate transport system substrate-binding protein